MALKPTIISPGVELIELDESLRASVPSGTTVFIPGYAAQGPIDEVLSISSLDEFETIFGTPTCAAERYFYQTVKLVLASSANVLVSRLPYGAGEGDTSSPSYTLLAYPVNGYKLTEEKDSSSAVTGYKYTSITKYTDGSTVTGIKDGEIELNTEGSATFIIGEPTQFAISLKEYYNLISNSGEDTDSFEWSNTIADSEETSSSILKKLGHYAFFTINIRKTVTNEKYEGFYLGLSDNAFFYPEPEKENEIRGYRAITSVKTVTKEKATGITDTDYTSIPEERFGFKLAGPNSGSVSQIMQESINGFDISDNQWNDSLNFGVFKIREATGSDSLKLTGILNDGFNASLEAGRKTTSKAGIVDFFAETITADSKFFNIFVNPYFSGVKGEIIDNVEAPTRGLNADGTPKIKVRVLSQRLIDNAEAASITSEEATKQAIRIFNSPYGITKDLLENVTIKPADALYPLGVYSNTVRNTKIIGNTPLKIRKTLELISNDEVYDVDLLLDAGLSTIYTTAKECSKVNGDEDDEDTGIFDDTVAYKSFDELRTSKTLNSTGRRIFENFNAVHTEFLGLASSQQEGGRGDVFYIGDGLRQATVIGKSTKIESKYGMDYTVDGTDSKHSFSTSIYWSLRQLFSNIVTSYMAVYPQFLKYNDVNTGNVYWYPSSGAVAAKMATTDALYGQWQAAAGRTNGILTGVLDVSFSTNQRQRDDLYKISLNCINATPSHGVLVWGIRTMVKKESVFDQITCRRTFLFLEKMLRATSANFLFEGNTDFTRLRVINTIDPVLQNMVNARALYDYVLICDTRNNTPDVIDDGNMRIDLYASPVRTAERILIAVHATKSGTITTEFDT